MIERAYWLGVLCLTLTLALVMACGGEAPESEELNEDVAAPVERPSGVIVNKSGATPGYVLFAPLLSDTTYLVDNEGLVVHTWKSPYAPQGFVYLRDNGHLLRGARMESSIFQGGGAGGRLEEYTWDGELYWSFEFPAPPPRKLTEEGR